MATQAIEHKGLPKFVQSFYTFKDYAHITDLDEDAYRSSKGLCPVDSIRCYSDKTRVNVWKLTDGDLTKVGIDGNDVYRPDLRSSVSIRNRFTMSSPDFLKRLFSKVRLGVGSKHIYVQKDFMRKHRDARLPDLDDLPHVMTLVVFPDIENTRRYEGGQLLIDDKDVFEGKAASCLRRYSDDDDYGSSYGCPMVLFPINSIHEVTEITKGERHTFVFPVYGHFDQFNRLIRELGSKKVYTTVYDEILDDIDDVHDSDDTTRAMFLGKLEVLDNHHLCRKFVKYRIRQGDYVPSEHAHGINQYDDHSSDSDSDADSIESSEQDDDPYVTVVEYCIAEEKTKLVLDSTTDTFQPQKHVLPVDARNVTVSIVLRSSILGTQDADQDDEPDEQKVRLPKSLAYIRDKVSALKADFNANLAANVALAKTHESKLSAEMLPMSAFIYAAKNMYYSDMTTADLLGDDAKILQLAKAANRKVHFAFISDLRRYVREASLVPTYYATTTGELLQMENVTDSFDHGYITSIYTEHDDQGGYDPRYSRMYCVLAIGHAEDV